MEERLYFHNLDKIRFFAAFAIFFGHGMQAFTGYFYQPNSELAITFFQRIAMNAPLGVELFFFISGFLITYILLKEKELTGKIAIRKFFIRRAIRIWPLYFLLIAITPFLISWLGIGSPAYWPNALFYGNFDCITTGASYPFSHFWSIAIEEQFYLVWPFIIAFVPIKRLGLVFVGLILGSVAFRYFIFSDDKVYAHLYYNTFSRMDTLVIGGCVALYFGKIKQFFQFKQWQVFLFFLGLIALLIFTEANLWDSIPKTLFKKYAYLAVLIPLTMHFICLPQPKTENTIGKILNYLGKSSYGLYMIHNFIILIVFKRIMFNNGLNQGWIFWGVYAAITFLVVIISFNYFEKPFLRLKKYFTVIKTRKY
jgi:peptidoglycan/LPS O-acetylase OafA/YrhL